MNPKIQNVSQGTPKQALTSVKGPTGSQNETRGSQNDPQMYKNGSQGSENIAQRLRNVGRGRPRWHAVNPIDIVKMTNNPPLKLVLAVTCDPINDQGHRMKANANKIKLNWSLSYPKCHALGLQKRPPAAQTGPESLRDLIFSGNGGPGT